MFPLSEQSLTLQNTFLLLTHNQSGKNTSLQRSTQRPLRHPRMVSNAHCPTCKQRTDLVWSTDLQQLRHHVLMPVVTTIDQPQLTLSILEAEQAEHMENLACERQLSQAIQLRFLHGTECKVEGFHVFSPLQPQQNGLKIPASTQPSRGTQK